MAETNDDLTKQRLVEDLRGAMLPRLEVRKGSRARNELFQVFNGGAMPTAVPGEFLGHPGTLAGAEREGQPWTFAPSSARSVVLVLGPKVPAVDDVLIGSQFDGRWVSGSGGTSGPPPPPPTYITIPGCACPAMPATIEITGSPPGTIFGNATLRYCTSSTPLFPLWVSTQSFSDGSTNPAFKYWYVLSCRNNIVSLGYVYTGTVTGPIGAQTYIDGPPPCPYPDRLGSPIGLYIWATNEPGNVNSCGDGINSASFAMTKGFFVGGILLPGTMEAHGG